MADSENSDFAGWNQVFNTNLTLLNQIHKVVWKLEHGRRGIEWSTHATVTFKGTQREAGKFSADWPNEYLWYTFTLHDGTYRDVKFDEWTVQFPVYFEKFQISDDELTAQLEDNELPDLIPWGLTIKIHPAYQEADPNCPRFDRFATQSPTPSSIEQQKGLNHGQVTFDLARWLNPNTKKTPDDAGPLGMILKLVPANKVSEERYHFGPTGFDCQIDPVNGIVSLLIMTQNRPLPSTTPNMRGEPPLKDYAGKLCISKEEFWDGWFLKKFREVAYNTQIWPIIPNQYNIGYNPDHPDINSSYYDFTRDYWGAYTWTAVLPEDWCPGEEQYVNQNLSVSFINDDVLLGATICVRLEVGEELYTFSWQAPLFVQEMHTDDGGLQVSTGPITWEFESGDYDEGWCKQIYAAMDNVVTSTVESQMARLVGLSNLHRFFVPGYDNFIAQDPKFNTADLYVDLYSNGVPS
ncbi:hypothetical protein BBP40_010955 [Aspergillus hancockii]|nr:hypothetical protein BBP40_010955 [Aspergillus hancockii]